MKRDSMRGIQTSPAPHCPSCGGRMVLRRPKPKAAKQFDPFWGCANYPDCTGTREILDDGKPDMFEESEAYYEGNVYETPD